MVEWPFYVKFSLLRTRLRNVSGGALNSTHSHSLLRTGFESIFYLFTVESVYIPVTSGYVGSGVADRDPQNIWNPQRNCESFVDTTSMES